MDFLALQAIMHANKVAITDLTSQKSWGYAQLHEVVAKTVTWFQDNNLQQGDRVACIAKNCAETVILSLACGRAGIMLVPINWRLSKEEVTSLLVDCEPKLVFADQLGDSLELEYVPMSDLENLVENSAMSALTSEYETEPSLILYTSGTTGVPKGVMHSEATIMETTLNMALLGYVDDKSVFLCEAPMFHVIGLVSSIRPVLYHGGTVLISDGFIPERTLQRMTDLEYGVTHYFCVPQMANILRQQESFNAEKLKKLKAVLTGGAPHPEVQIREWLNDGIPIVDGYGMSEAGTIFHMPFDIAQIDNKAGCVGVPGHRIQTRIADTQNNVMPIGEAGEVQVKGNGLFLGIWNKPDLYATCFTEDGWFKTGDIAIKDESGFHRIVDRIKDMFISGGENVYPVEIESIALNDPQIQECALVGMKDEQWGEVGCLFVVLQPSYDAIDTEKLLDTLGNSLARYKLPKRIQVVDTIPRTAAGKVQKNVLRRWCVYEGESSM